MIDFLRRYVIHNFLLKIISLAAAILLWLAVARNPITETALKVPIEFFHVPDGLELSTEHIPELQVRVRGPERLVHRMDQNDVHASIDLAGARPGDRTYDLTNKQIHLPSDVELVQAIPSQFRVSFDRRGTRQVPLNPRVIGTFAAGYHIESVTSDPATITITGPEKRVNAIESAITDPVDATGVVGTVTFTTHVYVSDPLVRILNPESVHVTVVTSRGASETGRRTGGNRGSGR